VADIIGLYTADGANQDVLRRASELPALPEGWRDYLRNRLWEPGVIEGHDRLRPDSMQLSALRAAADAGR